MSEIRKAIPEETWEALRKKGIYSEGCKNMATDWVKAYNANTGWQKYGRMMYSKSLDRLRSMDIMEFYGNGIVD